MNSLPHYQLKEILVMTLLVLPAGFQLFQPMPGMNREIA
jgi:hypothetical protein